KASIRLLSLGFREIPDIAPEQNSGFGAKLDRYIGGWNFACKTSVHRHFADSTVHDRIFFPEGYRSRK
ncbi:hypothetical protein, partial [Roseibium sp.]|uniref:hypothetical protein n=1 Tax=Roseibium sp. TaxID=1936156 RepID=UPI003D0A8242